MKSGPLLWLEVHPLTPNTNMATAGIDKQVNLDIINPLKGKQHSVILCIRALGLEVAD
jgi:hypothetical protein